MLIQSCPWCLDESELQKIKGGLEILTGKVNKRKEKERDV